MGEKSDTNVMLNMLMKLSSIIETAKYLSGIEKIITMNIRPKMRYNKNCKIDDEEDDFPELRFIKLIGFLFSKITLVSKMILNCS